VSEVSHESGWKNGKGIAMAQKVIIGDAELWHGDCLDILPTFEKVDAVVTDPPYGIAHSGDSTRFSGGNTRRGKGSNHGPIKGDEKPLDMSPFMAFQECILWGANCYLEQIGSGGFLIWVKRNDASFGSFLGDAEVAWKRGGTGVYCYRRVFAGSTAAIQGGKGAYEASAHPHQKPIEVMEWCLGFVKSETILDPFMGSGTTGVACANLGRKFIGIETERKYFDIACERIEAAHSQMRLFA